MRRKKIRPAKGQTFFDPAWGMPTSAEEARLPVYMSMTVPAVPMTLDVTHSDGETSRYPVLAVKAVLERVYVRAQPGEDDPPRFPTHAQMLKAGWVARELRERLDLLFYYPDLGLMTLAELRLAEPDAAVEVVTDDY
jgi:hypothetical protein